MPAPTSSLRFAGSSYVQPRIAGSPSPDGRGFALYDAARVTMAFWLKVNALPSYGWSAPVTLFGGPGLWPSVNSNGKISFGLFTAVAAHGGFTYAETSDVPINLGVADHWMAVFDGSGTGLGTLTVYRNGELTWSITTPETGPNTWSTRVSLILGNHYPFDFTFSNGDVELADVAVWNGYLGTAQDSIDLTNSAKRPSDISTPQRLIYISGDGGTVGADVGDTDAGILNQGHSDFASNEGLTYDFRAEGYGTGDSVQGTLKYSGPMSYAPPVVASPYVAASGQGLGLLFATTSGNKAHVPRTASRSTVIESGREPTLTITRSGGGTESHILDPDYCYFSNATSSDVGGKQGQDWIYFDLRAQGIAAISPNDTAHLSAARHWITLSEGKCDAIDIAVPRSGPLPAVPPSRTLRAGYNLSAPLGYTVPYYGNLARWLDAGQPRPDFSASRDPATGQWIPGTGNPGSYYEGTILNPEGAFGMDMCATRGPVNDGTGDEQYPNASYDNPAYGTSGFKLGNGYRTIPRRGKIHVAWDYYPGHDGDGTASVLLGPYGTEADMSLTGGGSSGNQVYSWTFNPATQDGPAETKYRTYEYVCNDPINGLGAHGARLTPQLRLRYTGYATNLRVTVEADSDLPEAAYNVDKFSPPVFHPYLTGELLRGVDTIRIMDWSDASGNGTSAPDQFTPYERFTWGRAYSDSTWDMGLPLSVGITAITPYTEPDATNLRAAYAGADGGGCPVKLTLASPHFLHTGAVASINWGGCVTLQCVSDQDGVTYGANMETTSWHKVVRVVSPTELLLWIWFDQPGGGKPYGILNRAYSGPELGTARVQIDRGRTLPLRALGELATQCGLNVHYCVPYAIASDPALMADWADRVAPYFPPGKALYLESGNEIWNVFGPYALALGVAGDDLGLVGGQMPNLVQKYAHHVRISARAAKVVRQRWAAHGLDPSKVRCLLNTGPGSFLPYAIPVIQEMNNSGDPLLRVDDVSPNTYWSNFGGDEGDMAAFPGFDALGVEQTLDLFELHISRGNSPFVAARDQRAALDAAGLSDVVLSSYEGGSELVTLGSQRSRQFDHTDIDTQDECARLARLQIGVFRNPRWAGIIRTALARFEEIGITRWTRYVASTAPWPGYDGQRGMISRKWWTSYLSMEPAGKGDGSDGKWDNRVSAGRPYGPYAEGDSVSVDAYAIKQWNAVQAANNRKKYPMIDWATPWTADSVVAATAMNHNDALTGDAIDLDSQSAVELGFTITKTEGNGTITVLMLNAVDGTSYESPGAASNGQVFALLPGAGTEHYRVQFDARTMSQAKPYIKASLGNSGIFNAQVVRISSITMKTRVGVEA